MEGSVLVLFGVITKSVATINSSAVTKHTLPSGQGPRSTFHTCGHGSRQDGPIPHMRTLRLARSWQGAPDLRALSPFPQ